MDQDCYPNLDSFEGFPDITVVLFFGVDPLELQFFLTPTESHVSQPANHNTTTLTVAYFFSVHFYII